ncbi:ectopic P granules protein 5 homolog [Ischnura elegans]|uniref:ectopic P granules protein 5 homolog n=1 Tax=Ischnura elegans TaxID=197161 RepID=UPI001ED866B9|nr:ectopic P granules protein 5 homolog [Ischnura elegans]
MATLEKSSRKKVKKERKIKTFTSSRESVDAVRDELCISTEKGNAEASTSSRESVLAPEQQKCADVTDPTILGDHIKSSIPEGHEESNAASPHNSSCKSDVISEQKKSVSTTVERDYQVYPVAVASHEKSTCLLSKYAVGEHDRDKMCEKLSHEDRVSGINNACASGKGIALPYKEGEKPGIVKVKNIPPPVTSPNIYPSISSVISFNEEKSFSKVGGEYSPIVKGLGDGDCVQGMISPRSVEGNVRNSGDFPSEITMVSVNQSVEVNEPSDSVVSPIVTPLPSAPSCDISLEEDSLSRIRCLEEESLRNLYPIEAFHVVLPSEATIKNHPLYVLLSDYLLACSHLEKALKRLDSFVAKEEELIESVWTITEKEVLEAGKCNDGAMLVAKYSKSVAVKDKLKLSQLSSTLSSSRETLHSEISLHLFDSEAQRLRVEHFVQMEEEAQAVIPSPEELRVCVVILFYFAQRLDLNAAFILKVQGWLLRLGKVLLKIGVLSDHLLLLTQLLHCPKGVGKWGTPLLQFHPPPLRSSSHSVKLKCPELELVMAALPVIVEAVDYSLSLDSQQKKESNDTWVVLDSFGEEEHNNVPGDEDLSTFLDQFPLKAIVTHALGISSVDHSLSLSGVDVLRLFALSNYSLKTLGSGLQKYGSRRYPRFLRKIAILVHHIVHLVTDLWDFFKSSKHYHCDPAMQSRIEVEFEALFIRAFGYLFHSTLHGIGWDILSQLPYKYLSAHALWHLLAVLHRCGRVNCEGDVHIPPDGIKGWELEVKKTCSLFDAALLAEPEDVSPLLLNTLKNMAISSEDVVFAEAVSFDMYRVALTNPETRETELSKTACHHLVSIFSKHPCLFSILIGWLKDASEDTEKGALDLFSSLPIHLWQPNKVDLKLLSSWILHHDPQTMKSAISRAILLALPWRGRSNEDGPLSLDVTISAAAVALDACLTWDGKGRIPSAMRFESVTSTWAWSLISVLCIHPCDRKRCQAWPQDPSSDYDLLADVLSRGLQDNHPLASLLLVLATEQGHTWEMAREHAFIRLSNVVAHGKHTAAISALYLLLPLYIGHSDELISCLSFQKLFLSLLFADRTYVKMAKSLIHHEFPGPLLLQLGNMVVSAMENSYRFGSSPSEFLIMWLKIVLLVPNWKNEMEALYLLDLVFRSAFFEASGRVWDEALTVFGHVTKQNMLHVQTSTGTLSSIMNLLARGPAPGTPRPFSHMAQSSYSSMPWFVLAALEVEEVHESFLWDQLQIEYRTAIYSLGSFSLDTIIKNACQTLGVLPFPAAYLCIYRWARQALDTPLGHPALLLIWVRFFSIYSKLFSCSEQSSCMLFEGSSFTALLAQLKKKLIESAEWYSREAESLDDHDTSLWHRHCSRLFHAFSVWLNGEKQSYQSPVHSQQYSPSRLPMVILYENRRSWQKEFVDVTQGKNQIVAAVKAWDELRKDFTEIISSPNYSQSSHYLPPLQRIHSRLRSCSDPMPLSFPSHTEPKMRLQIPQIFCGQEAATRAIINCVTPLLEYARLSSLHFSEHTALDCAFMELVPNLYQDVWIEFTRKVPCAPKMATDNESIPSCKGPAKIHFKVNESRMNEEVWADMERNAASRKRLTTSVLKSVPLEACFAGVLLENISWDLVSEKKKQDVSKVQDTALYVLNHLFRVLNDEAVMHCLPTKKLVTSCIENLVQDFVLGSEKNYLELLSQMLENPVLPEILSPLLTPTDLTTDGLLQAYNMLIKRLPTLDSNLAFVFLSKFKIKNWLSQQLALKEEKLSLVKLLIDGIGCCTTNEGDWTLVIGLFQKDLKLVLVHKFPEILIEVFELILVAIGDQHLPPIIWYDILDAIIGIGSANQCKTTPVSTQSSEESPDHWSIFVKEFSMVQNVLLFNQVKCAVTLFATFFRRERLHFGIHGLYPKYRAHIKPIQKVFELFGCSLLAITLRERKVVASATSSDSTWIAIQDLYSPWLLPYWEDELTGSECTVWIMELINGHPPLTPWIAADSAHARDMAASFIKCLLFMIDISPGHQNPLGLIWEMYCSAFARIGVGTHVLQVIHSSLLLLPWNRFWPSVKNLKDMVEVAESSSPECLCFLRTILSKVHWKEWTDSLSSSIPLSAQALACFLRILLLISGNSCLCKAGNCNMLPTLLAAQTVSWQNLNTAEYSALLGQYASRVNPKVVLSFNSAGNEEDENTALFKLLKVVGGLTEAPFSKDFHQKSLSFFHITIQLLQSVIENDQYASSKNQCEKALSWILQEMERIITSGADKEEMEYINEMGDVVKHVLIPFLAKASPNFIVALSKVVAPAVTEMSSQSFTIPAKGILLALQSSSQSSILLAPIIESAIETSLIGKIADFPVMDHVLKILLSGGEKIQVIGNSLSSGGYLLTLLALIYTSSSADLKFDVSHYEECLHLLVHRWLPSATVTEDIEAKIPLLWSQALILVHKLSGWSLEENVARSFENLLVLASSLLVMADGNEGMVSSLLGVVGLKRKPSLSKRFRVMCLAFSTFVFGCLNKEGIHDVQFKESMDGLDNLCCRYKEFREVTIITSSVTNKVAGQSLLEGTELIAKLFGRLYPERPGYLQCME